MMEVVNQDGLVLDLKPFIETPGNLLAELLLEYFFIVHRLINPSAVQQNSRIIWLNSSEYLAE